MRSALLLGAIAPSPEAVRVPARPRVGVAVVTFDRPRYLERCLANVAAQTYPAARTEVLVVDDTPGDAARRAVEARTGAPLACSRYVHPAAAREHRREAAARGDGAAGRARLRRHRDGTTTTRGADRLARQVAPIAAGAADATVATPYAWRWEDDAGRARMMTWGGLAGAALHRLDGDLGRGTELLDEAIASLCYDARLLDACAYPDASYDLCGNQPVRRAPDDSSLALGDDAAVLARSRARTASPRHERRRRWRGGRHDDSARTRSKNFDFHTATTRTARSSRGPRGRRAPPRGLPLRAPDYAHAKHAAGRRLGR